MDRLTLVSAGIALGLLELLAIARKAPPPPKKKKRRLKLSVRTS